MFVRVTNDGSNDKAVLEEILNVETTGWGGEFEDDYYALSNNKYATGNSRRGALVRVTKKARMESANLLSSIQGKNMIARMIVPAILIQILY